jgi:hypothetical protein
MRTPFDALGAGLPCRCPGMGEFDGVELCACPAREKALRAYMDRRQLPPMTDEQRAWCLSEIEQVESYSADDYRDETDRNLAHGVLCAWTDYCRGKGLIR